MERKCKNFHKCKKNAIVRVLAHVFVRIASIWRALLIHQWFSMIKLYFYGYWITLSYMYGKCYSNACKKNVIVKNEDIKLIATFCAQFY